MYNFHWNLTTFLVLQEIKNHCVTNSYLCTCINGKPIWTRQTVGNGFNVYQLENFIPRFSKKIFALTTIFKCHVHVRSSVIASEVQVFGQVRTRKLEWEWRLGREDETREEVEAETLSPRSHHLTERALPTVAHAHRTSGTEGSVGQDLVEGGDDPCVLAGGSSTQDGRQTRTRNRERKRSEDWRNLKFEQNA